MDKHKTEQKKNKENSILWTTKVGANNSVGCDLKSFPFLTPNSAKFNKSSCLIPRFVFPLKMSLECKVVDKQIYLELCLYLFLLGFDRHHLNALLFHSQGHRCFQRIMLYHC